MTRSHLVPTVIVDKNNKITTVHKRAGTKTGTGNTMPAPAASVIPQPTRAALLNRAKKIISDAKVFSTNTARFLAVDDLEGMKTPPLSNVVELMEQRGPSLELVSTLASISRKVPDQELLEYTSLMKDNFYRIKDTLAGTGADALTVSGFIRGLQNLRSAFPEVTADQGALIMDTLASIYVATDENNEYPMDLMWVSKDSTDTIEGAMFTMKSSDLREHIINQPEDAARVSELMNDNSLLSEAQLMYLLRNPNASVALSDGAL